jgi:hypothetical protein
VGVTTETTTAVPLYREVAHCRSCGTGALETVLDLGTPAIADFVLHPDQADRAPLVLCRCAGCSLVQLRHTVARDRLYRTYWYRSGVNEAMVAALKDVVDDAMGRVDLQPGDRVLDIGANDGTLLRHYPPWVRRYGFEPALGLQEAAQSGGNIVYPEFFPPDWPRDPIWPYKIITSIAQFYDEDDPNAYVAAIKERLQSDGVWVVQMQDLAGMLIADAVDNICHEHLCYYDTPAFEHLTARRGLAVEAVTMHRINGGSARTVVRHGVPAPTHAVVYGDHLRAFALRAAENKRATMALLHRLAADGKRVLGYGASTKGATLLQYYGIGPTLVPAIADRNPDKVGRYVAGTGIRVISEDQMRASPPDYLIAFPWAFIDAFVVREKDLLLRGTKFIVPLPRLRVIWTDGGVDVSA